MGIEFFKDHEKILEILSSGRNISHLELSNIDGNHNVLNALFQRFGSKISHLKISKSKIDDFSLKETLRLCNSLKELTLREVVIVKKLPSINSVRSVSLKILSVEYCDWEIFKFFTKSQLISLSVKSYLDEVKRRNLVTFLTSQYFLKELTLLGTSLRSLFLKNDIVCKFNLEKIHIDNGIGKSSENVNWNVISFLRLHEESLRNIVISGPHNELIASYALLNFENLQYFALDVRGLPKDDTFYEILENKSPNTSLYNLKLFGFFFQIANIKRILLKFPSVKNLVINDWGNANDLSDLHDFISKNLLQLEDLSISEISSKVKFQRLKRLNVNFIRDSQKLVDFIEDNNGIEMLKIGLIYISQIQNLVRDLKNLSKIKHLSIGGNKTALRAMLNNILLIRNLSENLKILEFSIISATNEEDKEYQNIENEGKIIRFNLPFNPIDLKLKYKILV